LAGRLKDKGEQDVVSKRRYYWYLGGACFMAYTACYAGRGILSAMLPQILQQTKFTKEGLGLVGSAFFFSYGFGQLVNGLLGDFISPKYMVATGLFLAGSLISLFPAVQTTALQAVLWGMCGLCCSMLWGPLSKLIAENTEEKVGRLLMTLLTVASLLGTMATFLLAAIISTGYNWSLAFHLTGAFLILTALGWYVFLAFLEERDLIKTEERKVNQAGFFASSPGFLLMTAVSLLNGVLRNAVVFWLPTYLVETFRISTTKAAAVSTVLPFVNLSGTFSALALLRKVGDKEERVLTVFFGAAACLFWLTFSLGGSYLLATLAAIFLASAAMTGACNMIFSVYCLRFASTGRVSAIAGFMDFTGYAAAAAANLFFTGLIASRGWNATVASWALLAAAGALAAFAAEKNRQPSKCFQSTP